MVLCPVCSYDRTRYIRACRSSVGQLYRLIVCPCCDTHFWEPRQILIGYYEKEERASAAYLLRHSAMWKVQYWHAPFLKGFSYRKGRLLDVGCGEGSFLVEVQKLGFDVYGIDLDSKSIRAAQEQLGKERVYHMTLAKFVAYAQERDISFDVITFFEVLQHQEEPRKFLENVKRILNPGGWIAGTTPNRNRLLVNIERKAGEVDFPPHHFFWFSYDSLTNLFQKSGFKPNIFLLRGTTARTADVLQVLLLGPLLRNARAKLFTHILNRTGTKKDRTRARKRLAKGYSLVKNISLLPFYLN